MKILSVSQFIKNADTIHSIWIDDITGNYGGHTTKQHMDFEAAKAPLQKGKKTTRKSFKYNLLHS